ncbi:radical SAM family heme chaperone HemW [Roseobacter sp. HKCCA0434]|uniref:radical SAM family heme chaperone HemW n=1 Tax=Roseobacter sp. HKCCA0434 TaxID=3079297 RepID=UPI002905CB90|nr:radical SAM family heme chaperone HemW [Roseobacter sp. HKCCA0434]
MAEADWQNGGFGVYVHWPFCQAKCPYCDFNSHVRREVDQHAWRQALVSEIEAQAALTGPRRVDTVFFGGGTPSLMEPETVATVLQAIGRYWSLAEDAEISLEANPTSVEAGRFAGYRDAGVNRISMGIQALNDADLRRLGRLHSAAEGLAAFDVARGLFERVSFDLIYARQDQTRADWMAELDRALALDLDHLSLYQLTIEAATRFGELHARGALRGLPSDARASDMYFDTQDRMERAGLPAYEISNHARADAQSRHNLVYWRYGDYAGIGPGAHGRLTLGDGTRLATEAERQPERWLDERAVERTALSRRDQALECLLMGLRLAEGVSRSRVEALDAEIFDPDAIARLEDDGLVSQDRDRLTITKTGRPLTNAILRELLI